MVLTNPFSQDQLGAMLELLLYQRQKPAPAQIPAAGHRRARRKIRGAATAVISARWEDDRITFAIPRRSEVE